MKKVTVTIADVADSEYVKTKSNLLIKTDAKLGDVKNNKFDAVVIPGGPSYKTLASVSFYFFILFLFFYDFNQIKILNLIMTEGTFSSLNVQFAFKKIALLGIPIYYLL